MQNGLLKYFYLTTIFLGACATTTPVVDHSGHSPASEREEAEAARREEIRSMRPRLSDQKAF